MTIVLREGPSDVDTLLIERTRNASDPASGDVALPGGRVDPGDATLGATALRELEEEVGLAASDLSGPLRFVGTMSARRFGLEVGVFAAGLASAREPVVGRPLEVAHWFWLPREALEMDQLVARPGVDGPPVVANVHEAHVLWGFTRRVLRRFFELPAEPREPLSPSDRRGAA